jgi:hypothetical protein
MIVGIEQQDTNIILLAVPKWLLIWRWSLDRWYFERPFRGGPWGYKPFDPHLAVLPKHWKKLPRTE